MTKCYQVPVSARNNFWSTDLEYVTECDKAPKKEVVWMTSLVRHKINLLMTKFAGREWLAYFVGNKTKDSTILMDLVFPERQVATAGSVTDVEQNARIKTIGVVHSHHSMGTFFSGTDHEYINQNHDISIVVSNSDMKGEIRVKTICGCFKIIPLEIRVFDDRVNAEEFLKEAVEKISFRAPGVYMYVPPESFHYRAVPRTYVERTWETKRPAETCIEDPVDEVAIDAAQETLNLQDTDYEACDKCNRHFFYLPAKICEHCGYDADLHVVGSEAYQRWVSGAVEPGKLGMPIPAKVTEWDTKGVADKFHDYFYVCPKCTLRYMVRTTHCTSCGYGKPVTASPGVPNKDLPFTICPRCNVIREKAVVACDQCGYPKSRTSRAREIVVKRVKEFAPWS